MWQKTKLGRSRFEFGRLDLTLKGLGSGQIFELSSEDSLVFSQLAEAVVVVPPPTFTSNWKTSNTSTGSSTSTQVKLPLVSTGTYNFTVNWGDGNEDTITTWDQAETTHTYAVAGEYEINITGTIEGWQFAFQASDAQKILDISEWGPLDFGSATANFFFCINLDVTAIDAPAVGTSLSAAFRGCSTLTGIGGDWDVSSVTNINSIFNSCPVFNQDISAWNTSNITDMRNAFFGASSFDQPIQSWNVSKVTLFDSMFRDTLAFNRPIGSWTLNNISTMSFVSMFNGATAFDQDLGAWNVTQLVNAGSMFSGATLSTANYNALLVGWESQAVQNNVSFHGGNSTHSGAGTTARTALINDHTWTITDGGAA